MTRYLVAKAADVPAGERLVVQIEGRSVGVFNVDGDFFALLDRCPHAGAALCSFGTVYGVSSAPEPDAPISFEGGRSIRCPWHQWEFDIRTGEAFYDRGNTRVRRYGVDVVPGVPPGSIKAQEAPFALEGYEVSVEGDDLVVDTSRRRGVGAPTASQDLNVDSELTLIVAAKRVAADGVVAVDLEPLDGEVLPAWRPGAHIDLLLDDDLVRQYSLCGSTGNRSWSIGVLREPNSRGGSRYVHDQIQVGDKIRVRGPRNNFELVTAGEYLFIAGGIGITPLLPMIEQCSREGLNWRLVYGGRTRSSMAFLEELAAHGEHVTVCPQDESGLIDLDTLLGAPRPGVAVYCCGPGVLLDAVEDRCGGWPEGALHVERFRASDRALDGTNTEFEVVCDRSGVTVTVTPDQTIAQAVTAAGIELPTSCGEGTCGTCETDILEGLPDHRDSYLTAQERSSNEVMTPCCSRSLSPRLVLDL